MRSEIVVIGAGPAGMAAAANAAELGARVIVVDAGEHFGGQYFRNHGEDHADASRRDWDKYVGLSQRLAAQQQRGMLTYLSRSSVWSVSETDGEFVLRVRKGERDESGIELHAARLILATGAHDRALAFDGWDAPGSITVGGLQATLKGSGVVAGKRIVIAGTGPFLLATAADVVKAGGTVVAVVEAQSFTALSSRPSALIAGRHKIGQAIELLGTLRRAKVRMIDHATVLTGNRNDAGAIRSATIATRRGQLDIECDVLATGWGFEPNVELAVSLGLDMELGANDALSVVVDENQRTSHARVWVAGEIVGIAGSDVALAEGAIAGVSAAVDLGRPTPDTAMYRRERERGRTFAKYLNEAYPIPADWARALPDSTTLCRCEEVTVGDVRAAIDEFGAEDVRAVKLFSRVGMGWCQGRMCAANCADVIRCETGVGSTTASVTAANKRTIAQPVTLGMVADWDAESV